MGIKSDERYWSFPTGSARNNCEQIGSRDKRNTYRQWSITGRSASSSLARVRAPFHDVLHSDARHATKGSSVDLCGPRLETRVFSAGTNIMGTSNV
jgi:hypothetical protein